MESRMACTAFSLGRNLYQTSRNHSYHHHSRLFAKKSDSTTPRNIGIVGGGLAGLSTAFHLLQKQSFMKITILDKAPVGTAGASSVAGGLVHPLSPRGKLVHLGLEGLQATNELIEQASKYKPNCVLREELYRVALNDQHIEQLQQTAFAYPDFCKWIDCDEMQDISHSPHVLGGLQLSNGCKVLYVPSYLEGLWMACERLSRENDNCSATWEVLDSNTQPLQERLAEFDAVVLAAGAGLFCNDSILSRSEFPIDLIRGQSVEMNVSTKYYIKEALLCGKYISPLPQDNRVLIGATHEWKDIPLDTNELVEDLKKRSYELAPNVWDFGKVVKTTTGFRVQSRRGKFGRSPIIGQLSTNVHSNAWIFTGLSSRGILYHGLYGDLLTDAILGCRNETLWHEYNLDWWQ